MNPKKAQALTLLFGGLLPIIAFTIVEEKYGPLWGTIVGMSLGLAEILYEKIRLKKVSSVTWISNALILGLGLISIFSQDGLWFKLQPAIFEGFFAFLLWGSAVLKKPLLTEMAFKQNPSLPMEVRPFLDGLTVRVGIFFFVHAVIATWAAFSWSTSAWAWLKGAGVTVTFILYLGLEILFLRIRARKVIEKNLRTKQEQSLEKN